tara:strand:- start:199 stop:423 length:225 start_codon:yes stop_codon:yes gene_type:complete
MKYAEQMQEHLNRLDNGLLQLNQLIKKGDQQGSLKFMEEDLKELYDNLQNIVTLSQVGNPGNLGASGVSNTGMF